jgi:rhodanese-related sulfurtransferase
MAKATQQSGVTRVTADEVKQRMDRGEPLVLVDARNPHAWGESDEKLPGAIRIPAAEVAEHLDEIPPGRAIITYCT